MPYRGPNAADICRAALERTDLLLITTSICPTSGARLQHWQYPHPRKHGPRANRPPRLFSLQTGLILIERGHAVRIGDRLTKATGNTK